MREHYLQYLMLQKDAEKNNVSLFFQGEKVLLNEIGTHNLCPKLLPRTGTRCPSARCKGQDGISHSLHV